MANVPTGTTFFVASALGSALTVSAATNASECQLTSTAHGLSNGDIVLTSLGWGRIDKRLFRVKSVATNTFVLEGCDTTNTTFFPNGTTTGSVQKVTTWQQVTQVLQANGSGGDPKNVEFKYYESDVAYSINDGFSATVYTFALDADSIGTAGYSAMKTLTDTQNLTGLKMVMRSGSIVLYPGTVALNENVQLQDGQINRVSGTMNCQGRITRYAS
jgi:hypothetical protein